MEGFFSSSRGVKLGNLLSPCLFIIAAKVLSRGLKELMFTKKTTAFSRPIHCPIISHLAFADDMVIFTNGYKQSLQHLGNFLSLYEQESCQSISKEMSCYIVEIKYPMLDAKSLKKSVITRGRSFQ